MALKYSGPLFGKIGRKHIPLKAHSDDVDKMECDIASLRSALAEKTAQVERLREAGSILRGLIPYDDWPCECDDWDEALAATSPASPEATHA